MNNLLTQVQKLAISIKDVQEEVLCGAHPILIIECIEGKFIWDNDIMEYVPYNEYTKREHEWRRSKDIFIIPLELNMTSDELMLCIDAGQRPIRRQICRCIDGDFIWDEEKYQYIPYQAP